MVRIFLNENSPLEFKKGKIELLDNPNIAIQILPEINSEKPDEITYPYIYLDSFIKNQDLSENDDFQPAKKTETANFTTMHADVFIPPVNHAQNQAHATTTANNSGFELCQTYNNNNEANNNNNSAYFSFPVIEIEIIDQQQEYSNTRN